MAYFASISFLSVADQTNHFHNESVRIAINYLNCANPSYPLWYKKG